jgi:hypothetical protein
MNNYDLFANKPKRFTREEVVRYTIRLPTFPLCEGHVMDLFVSASTCPGLHIPSTHSSLLEIIESTKPDEPHIEWKITSGEKGRE